MRRPFIKGKLETAAELVPGDNRQIADNANAPSEPQGGDSVIAGAGVSDSAPKAASGPRSPLRN